VVSATHNSTIGN